MDPVPARSVQMDYDGLYGVCYASMSNAKLVQVPAILAMVISRFSVTLAERMGGYQGILERQTNAFTLSLKGGCWLKFAPRKTD